MQTGRLSKTLGFADWHALQDTLKQVQTIRTYYDFVDVMSIAIHWADQTRQVMLAARELDVEKLPESVAKLD